MPSLPAARIIIVSNDTKLSLALEDGLKKEGIVAPISSGRNILEVAPIFDKHVLSIVLIDTDAQTLTQTYLQSIMQQYHLYIVLLSNKIPNDSQFVRIGIKDLVRKSTLLTSPKIFVKDIATRIKTRMSTTPAFSVTDVNNMVDERSKLITIASSTGGTEALLEVLQKLPAQMPPILIVQHMPPVFTGLFAERLNKACAVNVCEAKDGEFIKRNTVYIAPGDFHMRMVKKNSKFAIEVFMGDKVNCARPAADVLFYSIASITAKNVVGVILTGMGSDGAKGLLELRRKGARTIGQDDKSSVVYGMPKAAYNIGAVEYQEPLNKIADRIIQLSSS